MAFIQLQSINKLNLLKIIRIEKADGDEFWRAYKTSKKKVKI